MDAVLQIGVGLAGLVCSAVFALRAQGASRIWRLFVFAGMLSWLVAEICWRVLGDASSVSLAPAPSVTAYFLPPTFVFVALLVLAGSSGALTVPPDGPIKHSVLTYVLDGVVAGTSFSLLVFMGLDGAVAGAAVPRSGSAPVALAYALLEAVVVVSATLITMRYQPDRPHRTNYLLLAGGVVVIAGSDRMVAYLHSVDETSGAVWAGIGFVLGPLLIAYSVLEWSPQPGSRRSREAMNWTQLVLPYSGFIGIAALFAFHVLQGQPPTAVMVWSTVALVLLVAARQVIAMHAQHLLMQRLVDAQRLLAHQVHHDSLTGLPNRLMFGRRLDSAMRDGRFVLIFVDLDDFKDVNDRFGHAAGDELLRAVGERLQRCVREPGTVARIGGDEFAILIDDDIEAPEVVADRLRVALRDPFAVHGSSVRVRASMGLVRTGVDEPMPSSDDLMRQADISMYAGKRLGKDTAVVYRPASGASTDFAVALRRAKGTVPDGFSLAYQPIVRLPEATVVAVEALARWTAPNGTQIPPETFVAAAEAAGLGADLDAMVLSLACGELKAAGVDVDLHVNIGAARLGNLDFEQELRRTLARCGIPPTRLVLEITETVPIVDIAEAAAEIARLDALGVRVALDDFGAGYNSLTYLHSLPVRVVKLDRGLAVGVEPNEDMTLYRSVIGLCHALGLEAVAEGIESPQQAQTVAEAGCRLAQGHLFGAPAPISALDESAVGECAGLPVDTP
ncbi:putative bifunctional diguanylate cyclase/phosphodiesterase [Mycobacterium deserti]|uniref:EAL domain-containing protein n=1 Tax=Mycobacterium deserti TaxID=2978347 RepID=A0ABT2MFL8_9MYCO|nr:EAL domain-containing protein [Mycobacterium deserti]MCT7661078.1 EAL domain-containing protein [Mycobacterium deserti]